MEELSLEIRDLFNGDLYYSLLTFKSFLEGVLPSEDDEKEGDEEEKDKDEKNAKDAVNMNIP